MKKQKKLKKIIFECRTVVEKFLQALDLNFLCCILYI
nr:MAG TPA: hypothetical protein [Caudoviricetes sp.]